MAKKLINGYPVKTAACRRSQPLWLYSRYVVIHAEMNHNQCQTILRKTTLNTVKNHLKGLGLYKFTRGFGWGAYMRWAYQRKKQKASERRHKTCLRNELKLTYHYI